MLSRTPPFILIGWLLGCNAEVRHIEPLDVRIEQWDVLITPDDSDVGIVYDMDVAPDGSLWLADGPNAQIIRVDPADGTRTAFGGSGDGPGEFRLPTTIVARDDGVVVLDLGTHRVSRFTSRGDFVDVVATYADLVGPMAINGHGDALSPGMGYGGGLAELLRPSESGTWIGELVVTPVSKPYLVLQQEAVRTNEVPQNFRNLVIPAIADDRRTWLVLHVEGEVRAFDPSSQLVWSQRLPPSAVETSTADYLRRINEPAKPNTFAIPNGVSMARLVGEELWIVCSLFTADESGILVLDAATGELRATYRLPRRGRLMIAVDSERRKLFLATPDEGTVAVAPLPERE